MSDNIHTKSIPKEAIEQALRKIDEAIAILHPNLYSLTPDDRQRLLKMGDKSLAFVEKTGELAETNPQFAPSYFDLSEFKTDFADAVNLRTVANRLQQFSREVDDTAMLAGSEAFTQALSYYNSVKQAARDNIPGAQALFDELKKRFVLGRPGKNHETNA
ncbi:MAG: hypothetical protein LBK58_02225 [Prevotellaceae bacterium]|jgi:hypothetical protein|nr:hypothetical protein [Prevotellaceae bacterium]